VSSASSPNTAFKKKLHKCRPCGEPEKIAAQITSQVVRDTDGDPLSIERGVRQRLADKITDTMVGLWLLVPEHLRLGTWDLLCGWTRQPGVRVEPRLALQMVHEAALCLKGVRERRYVALRGFETLNGLPFLATDTAMHFLLDSHAVAEAQRLQVALGKIRRVSGHYAGKLLLIDPHRPLSYSRRHMRRHRKDEASKPVKTGQMFFCLDADTAQPLCCMVGTSARTVTQATPELLDLAAQILEPRPKETLVAADNEHFTAELIDHVHLETPFDFITPIANQQHVQQRLQAIPPEEFTRQWAGYATAVLPYTPHNSHAGPYYELVQRQGELPDQWHFNAFLSTTDRHPIDALTRDYPKRWHLEEFFNFNQALGWQHAGTLNLNIRYGQMTMALLAQAAIHQLRSRLGQPYQHWDAKHLASALFRGLEGDIRVLQDTIVVTYYNAPNADLLRGQYEGLPAKLAAQNVDPHIPWLYGFQLDFRFK
jgi:hypothetical protein